MPCVSGCNRQAFQITKHPTLEKEWSRLKFSIPMGFCNTNLGFYLSKIILWQALGLCKLNLVFCAALDLCIVALVFCKILFFVCARFLRALAFCARSLFTRARFLHALVQEIKAFVAFTLKLKGVCATARFKCRLLRLVLVIVHWLLKELSTVIFCKSLEIHVTKWWKITSCGLLAYMYKFK